MFNQEKIYQLAHETIDIETQAVLALHERIDKNLIVACEYLLACKGRIVVTGMGKSSHISSKIAATFASTGSPAFFVHPGEASHGDLGMIVAKDVVLAISYSGNTQELLTLIPAVKRLNVPLIAMTGNPNSILAKEATVNLDVGVNKEACPMGLAPTSSTTVAMVMGDILAISLLTARGFTAKDFALSHPGGMLGKRLLLLVNDLMRTGDAIPTVSVEATLSDALVEMTQKRLGMTCVIDATNKLTGIYTDGDLRRTLEKHCDVHTTKIKDVMTKNCKTVAANTLAIDVLRLMEQYAITALAVVNEEHKILGVIHMHDILKAGLV